MAVSVGTLFLLGISGLLCSVIDRCRPASFWYCDPLFMVS